MQVDGPGSTNHTSPVRELRPDEKKALRTAIREARKIANLRQSDLAAALGLAGQSSVSKWETGADVLPELPTLLAIDAACGLTPGYVLARAGLIEAAGVEPAIAADPALNEEARRNLVRAYRDAAGKTPRHARRQR